jgi:hypothetical protein
MNPDAELESHLIERRVGVLAEFGLRHILARGYNAKEKPVERFFKELSRWEANTFAEYCGSHPQARPDGWRKLYRQHEQFLSGRRHDSPFISFDDYEEKLKNFMTRWHQEAHERITLGGKLLVPLEEHNRLYTTRYEMSAETVALALLRPGVRTVGKNGVRCFRRDWSYWHPAFSAIKGQKIEIRFTGRDYKRIWAVLPDKKVIEAQLITPTPLLNPNQETLQLVASARRQEKKIIDEFQLLTESQLRGESVEDRVARKLIDQPDVSAEAMRQASAVVHRLTRLDRRPPEETSSGGPVEIDKPGGEVTTPVTIREVTAIRVNEVDEDEEAI